MHRPDGLGPLDGVDRVELGGDLAELLGAHEVEGPGEIGAAQVGLLLGRRSQGAFAILHSLVRPCSLVDQTSEHDRSSRRTADHRGVRPLDGEHLHVVVELC